MKLRFVPLMMMCLPFWANAQQTWADTVRRHSIGVDVSAFLFQYAGPLVVDSNAPTAPRSLYWASYRYRFHKGWNLRFAMGGQVAKDERPWPSQGFETYTVETSAFSVRAGVERTQELAKRWQIFYGLDIRPAWSWAYTDRRYSSGYYYYGQETTGTDWAVGPLLGIRFRITPRFSLLTETSLAYVATERKQRDFTTPMDADHAPQPDATLTTRGFHTLFQPPLNVTATFTL
ncbi:MAG: hypothetical protein M9900_12160 [Flavobacteriales bacterium]|nr:hypothetical protein [Flavobacteriales bacterium]